MGTKLVKCRGDQSIQIQSSPPYQQVTGSPELGNGAATQSEHKKVVSSLTKIEAFGGGHLLPSA